MTTLLANVDDLLRGDRLFVDAEHRRLFWVQVRMVLVGGLIYGAVMGSFKGLAGDGWKQILLSATKVPFLFLVTFLLCIPSFYVLNALAGLRHDFPRALNSVLGFQSLAAVVLASLAPITELMNLSTTAYRFMIVWSGLMFAIATIIGQWKTARLYRPLIAANPRHRYFLWTWITLYWFVGIQMAWVLRPFVGDPASPFQIFRQQAWGNAYVHVAEILWRLWQ